MSEPRRLLAACSTAYLVIGVWVATTISTPLLSADDVAYLAMGRTVAGHGAAPLPAQPPYGILYPALTAPGWAIGMSEDAVLVYAQVLNALMGALLVPVLYMIVDRFWRPGRGITLVAALVGAGLPALWLTSTIAWTERLLALLVALAVLALLRLAESPTNGRLAVAILSGVACFATHPRMGAAAMVVIVAAALVVWSRGWLVSAIALAGGIALNGAAEVLRRVLASAAFDSTGTYDTGDLISRRGFGEAPKMLQHGIGTLSYLVLAGTGLVILGFVMFCQTRRIGLVVPALLIAVVVVAGWFLTGVPRSDAWLHGRYVEVVAPVLVAAGVVAIPRYRWKVLAVALFVLPFVAGVFAAWNGPGNNWSAPRSPVMMLGVEVGGAPFGNDVFEPGAAALVAIVVGLGAWGVSRVGRPSLLAGWLALCVGMGVASGIEGLRQLHDGAIAGQVALALDEVDPIEELLVGDPSVSRNLVAAMAWEVGFDATTSTMTEQTTHVLLPSGAAPPAEAVMVADLAGGTLWELA